MHDQEVVGVHNDANVACEIGFERHGSASFSIVRIGAKPLSLGSFTFALT